MATCMERVYILLNSIPIICMFRRECCSFVLNTTLELYIYLKYAVLETEKVFISMIGSTYVFSGISMSI